MSQVTPKHGEAPAVRAASTPDEISAASRRWDWRELLERFGPLLGLILLAAFCAIFSPVFLKPENLRNILLNVSFIGIIAVGMTIVIISGGIDLSVGSLAALAGGLGLWVMGTSINAQAVVDDFRLAHRIGIAPQYPIVQAWLAEMFIRLHLSGSEAVGVALAVVVIVAAGLLGGLLNGLIIAKGRVAPFVATLGTMAAFRSIALAMADGGNFQSATHLFERIGNGGVPIPGLRLPSGLPLTLPYPVILFAIVAATGAVVLNRTRLGRYVYAIGCNERAAIYSAVNVDRVKILTYALLGLTVGIAALLLASWMNSVSSSNTGNLYELDAIAAVVIGGTLMQGGSGTIFGTVIGVLILGVIGNMLNLFNVNPYLQGLVKGAIIIAAVMVQQAARRRS